MYRDGEPDIIEQKCSAKENAIGGLLSIDRRKKMREIEVSMLTDVIEKLCIEANEHLPSDVKEAIRTVPRL